MISPFIVNDKNLFLDRYPANQVTRSLQAWDSADELLISHIQELELTINSTILIFNDSFGALTLSLTSHQIISVSDSKISELGINHNAEQNYVSMENITLLDSLTELPETVDVILYKIPKSKNLMAEQLANIRHQYDEPALFIAADKAKNIHSSTLKTFEKILGTTITSRAVKKSRLVFSELNAQKAGLPNTHHTKTWKTDNNKFDIVNYANVFARDKLDIGARVFLANLPVLNDGAQVIDLGCGNGVLGLHILAQYPNVSVTFSDESYMAIASARATVMKNLPDQINRCKFMVNDCLADYESNSVDHIVCNPPFHQQNATTDHIAWQMFNDSFRALKKGGYLTIVGNRQLGYHIKLKRIFNNEKLVASDNKFVVITAKK